jgi:threonine synthase
MKAGNTPLMQIENFDGMERNLRIRVKDEYANPLHTHKDRRSALIVKKAVEQGADTLAIITAGNAGYSLARYAEGTGLRIVTLIDRNLRPSIRKILESASTEVKEVDLSGKELASTEIIQIARLHERERVWDVSNGFEEAYEDIFHEIAADAPQAIIAPVGSAELLLGLHRGIQRHGLKTRLLGVGVLSPQTRADKLYAAYLPAKAKIEALLREGHCLLQLTEEEVEWGVQHVPAGINAEPSAAVVFSALRKVGSEVDNVVLINTGKGIAV